MPVLSFLSFYSLIVCSPKVSRQRPCVYAQPCEELPTPSSTQPKILSLLSLTLLCLPAVMSLLSSSKFTLYVILAPGLKAKLSQNFPSAPHSFLPLSFPQSRPVNCCQTPFGLWKVSFHRNVCLCISGWWDTPRIYFTVSEEDQDVGQVVGQCQWPGGHKMISVSTVHPSIHTQLNMLVLAGAQRFMATWPSKPPLVGV